LQTDRFVVTVFGDARRFLLTLEEADHLTPEIRTRLFLLNRPGRMNDKKG